MTSTSSTLSIQKRPEKELVLSRVVENARDGTQYPIHFSIGKHMGIEFSISVLSTFENSIYYLTYRFHVENKAQESKHRAWRLPCRYSLLHNNLSKMKATVAASNSVNEFCLAVQHLTDDSFKFMIRVWVPDCLKPFDDPRYSDASILVDGEEFLVSKLFLSSQCTFFDSAFKWAEEQGREPKITVDTFYAHEVQRFLGVIHGEFINGNDDVEALLEMSRYFDSPTGIRRSAHFVLNSSRMRIGEKFRLASKFAVAEVKKLLIDRVKNLQELEELIPRDRSNLDRDDLSAFFDKSMELHRQGRDPPPQNAQRVPNLPQQQHARLERPANNVVRDDVRGDVHNDSDDDW